MGENSVERPWWYYDALQLFVLLIAVGIYYLWHDVVGVPSGVAVILSVVSALYEPERRSRG